MKSCLKHLKNNWLFNLATDRPEDSAQASS
jgi:hypothetical protein